MSILHFSDWAQIESLYQYTECAGKTSERVCDCVCTCVSLVFNFTITLQDEGSTQGNHRIANPRAGAKYPIPIGPEDQVS